MGEDITNMCKVLEAVAAGTQSVKTLYASILPDTVPLTGAPIQTARSTMRVAEAMRQAFRRGYIYFVDGNVKLTHEGRWFVDFQGAAE